MIKKKIIFKIWKFPQTSETFILAQILTALHCKYDVQLLLHEYLPSQSPFFEAILKKYRISSRVIMEEYGIPASIGTKVLKWIVLVIKHLNRIRQVIRFYKKQDRFHFSTLFVFDFYCQFDSNAIFHIEYGTNSNPVAQLKEVGLLKNNLIVSFHGHDAFFPINGFIAEAGYYNDLFKVANTIHVNTPYLEHQLLEIGAPKGKMKIVPVSVDTTFFYPLSIPKDYNDVVKIIAVGRLDPVKGHRYLIKAVSEIVKKGTEVDVTIVGEGEQRKELEKLIRELGLHKNVSLIGRKTPQEIRSLFRESDIFVMSSVALPSGRRETQGLVTGEAQACGLPVIAFDSGGIKYTFEPGQTGLLVEEANIFQLVTSLSTLIADPEKRRQMAHKAPEFIKKYNSHFKINDIWCHIYGEH